MSRPTEDTVMRRMRTTLDLFELAVKMQRQNIRRRNPAATPVDVEHQLQDWLAKRGGGSFAPARARSSRSV